MCLTTFFAMTCNTMNLMELYPFPDVLIGKSKLGQPHLHNAVLHFFLLFPHMLWLTIPILYNKSLYDLE